jgi:hypothetical protein
MPRGNNFLRPYLCKKRVLMKQAVSCACFLLGFLLGVFGMPKRFGGAQTLRVISQEYPVE